METEQFWYNDVMVDSILLHGILLTEDAGSGERADAAANRVRLLQAAEQLFAERGVANVSMADIAKTAGVGKGTLYRRFAHKGELCLALMDSQFRDFQNVILGRLRQMTMTDVPMLHQLNQFLDALVYFNADHMLLLCEVQHSGIPADENTAPYFWQHLTVQGLLRGAVAAGELSPDLDVELLADVVLAPLRPQSFRFLREQRGFELDRISAGIQSFVTNLGRGCQEHPAAR
ncbi:MAG: TetR/AcrR family transcriptional regulator [Anaerolineales bacterium]|nr:TetR/AcrR family transcriptional regulator [Anaerolineales bacterium]MCB8953575.1 TetR/AcrR family transcriptional regulator [Ardenticatenales bacterium]